MGRTTKSAVRKGKDIENSKLHLSAVQLGPVGPATSTPAVKATKRKRPVVMPSPGMSPLKPLQEQMDDSMVDLKPPSSSLPSSTRPSPLAAEQILSSGRVSSAISATLSPSLSSRSLSDDAISVDSNGSGDAANCMPSSSTERPTKRRRPRKESINAAVEKLKDDVKDHFEEIEAFSLEFV
ncbi:uncharacterized protein LOC135816142 [Sycon ciliatum]|uniref:uncharacterized protein LOC135816142 n=1 Tax=Sycon ciliatum TaxID=27933 RepID=UPI0020AB9C82|eukprot:scpid99128/ scgid9345/ 